MLEFRRGVTAFLKKEKLIAKNISNCPTIEIERLNELLTGRHLITLNEDNKFIEKHNKEIYDKSFRNLVFLKIIFNPDLISKCEDDIKKCIQWLIDNPFPLSYYPSTTTQ